MFSHKFREGSESGNLWSKMSSMRYVCGMVGNLGGLTQRASITNVSLLCIIFRRPEKKCTNKRL